jgi:hypothetical protein
MKKIFLSILLLVFYCEALLSQSVGIGTTTPRASSLLDITSTNKGVLLPRLSTAQRLAIVNPDRALLVFDTDKGNLMMFDGTRWRILSLDEADKINLTNRSPVNPTASGKFGQAVDISGNYAIVGAPYYRSPVLGNQVGEAFIFYKDDNGWKQQARLAAPDSASFNYFGGAVAIINDYCIVGCPNKFADGNYRQGKVYIFKRNGTAWTLDAALTYPGVENSYFGYSVDITLNSSNIPVVAVGAPGNAGTGQVITFKRVNNTWLLLQVIAPADLSKDDYFGESVSMQQDYLAVGSPTQTNALYNLTQAGAAYVFVYGGGVFTQQQKFQGSYKGAEFGFTLALYGNKLAVASPYAVANGQSDGSADVVVIRRTGAVWDYTYTPFYISVENGGSYNMLYGISLAISDNQLLIGAPGGIWFPPGGGIGSGKAGNAFLFYTPDDGSNYYLKQKLVSSYAAAGDLFANSVSLAPGGDFIIGIPEQNITTTNGFFTGAGGVFFGF